MRSPRTGLTSVISLGIVLAPAVPVAAPALAETTRVPVNVVVAQPMGTYEYLCYTSLKRLKTLRPSSTRTYSYDAYTLQDAHIYLDFPPPVPIKLDGWYGPATASAVKAYQRSRHLYVDGVVGPQTWRQLRNEIC